MLRFSASVSGLSHQALDVPILGAALVFPAADTVGRLMMHQPEQRRAADHDELITRCSTASELLLEGVEQLAQLLGVCDV